MTREWVVTGNEMGRDCGQGMEGRERLNEIFTCEISKNWTNIYTIIVRSWQLVTG